MIYYGNQRQLEYDFKLAPGADFKAIRVRYDGAQRIRIDDSGDLVSEISAGEIRQRRPVVYQEEEGARREIAGRYALKSEREVGFEIGSHDKSKPLIIDPTLTYSTYLGGSLQAGINAVALDTAGNAYVVGTSVGDFPGSGRTAF